MNNSPKFVIIVGIIIALLVIGGVVFWYFGGEVPFVGQKEEGAVVEVKDGLGAKALEKTNNPLSNELPETNPFKIKTNPFK